MNRVTMSQRSEGTILVCRSTWYYNGPAHQRCVKTYIIRDKFVRTESQVDAVTRYARVQTCGESEQHS